MLWECGGVDTPRVFLLLVPVVLGLALSSSTELSFTLGGFLAAVANNCTLLVHPPEGGEGQRRPAGALGP